MPRKPKRLRTVNEPSRSTAALTARREERRGNDPASRPALLRRRRSGTISDGQHDQVCAAPIVSAILAPRAPSGFDGPEVLCRAV